MSIVDALERLQRLHASGDLTDAEYAAAKTRLLEAPITPPVKQLQRSRDGAWLAGVCSGLARFTGVPAFVWRIGFLVFMPAAGISLLLYTLMAFFLPIER